MGEGEQFLHQQQPELHTTKPVEHEKERKKRRNETTSQKPAEKIADWFKVIEKSHAGHRENPEVAERIKKYYHEEYAIKPEDIPENYWDLQRKIIVNEGRSGDFEKDEQGKIFIPEQVRQQATEVIIADQKQSLDKWVDYLTSVDADVYPMWAKYWAFQSMVKMGKLEKKEDEKGNGTARFQKRTEDTVAAFPPLNPRALAMTIGVIVERVEEKSKQKKERKPTVNKSVRLDDKKFQDLLSTENFSKIYAQFLIEMPEYSEEGLQETRGLWKKYEQGSDPKPLVKSLEGHPLEWCTANIDTARTQLRGGDFWVYYSFGKDDKPENPTVPRVAIRMYGDKIAEVRGIAHDQNMDPYIGKVVGEKLSEFPDGKAYEKKNNDMKLLTEIAEKTKRSEALTKDELVFLYEINSPIEGFGYQRDPRIKELCDNRDLKKDLPVFFECRPDQIALGPWEIKPDTVAYIGKWTPKVLNLLPEGVKYIYKEFPGAEIFRTIIETNSNIKNADDAKIALEQKGFKVPENMQAMLKNVEFSGQDKKYEIFAFSGEDLGIKSGPDFNDIISKAEESGLELCPAEIVPQLCLQYQNRQHKKRDEKYYSEKYRVAMKPIQWEGYSWAFRPKNTPPKSSTFHSIFEFGYQDKNVYIGSHSPADKNTGSTYSPTLEFIFVRPSKK